MALTDKQVQSIVDGLNLPESATKDEIKAALYKEFEATEKAAKKGTTEDPLHRATTAALQEVQQALVDKAIDERNKSEVENKVEKDFTEADKDAAIRHGGDLAERIQKAVPWQVPDRFEVHDTVDADGQGRSHLASDMDKVYLFKTDDEQIEILKQAVEDCYITGILTGRRPNKTRMWARYAKYNPDFVKAMATVSGSEGEDWVPTGFSSQVLDLVRVPHRLIEQHPHIVMPTDPYKMPTVASDTTVYIAGERTLDDDVKPLASNITTANKTLNAVSLAVRTVFSGELEEDSIIPILPTLRANLGFAYGNALDDAMVEGDPTATHHNTGTVPAAAAVTRAWRGYVECALTYDGSSNILDMTGAFTFDNVVKLQELLAQYGAQGQDTMMYVTGYKGYRLLKHLKDSSNNNIMVDYGAARQSQDVPNLDGIQVIRTDKVRGDLNASGIYDASTTAFTILLLVYKPAYIIGDRRSLQFNVVPDYETDQRKLIGMLRMACTNVYESSTHFTVAMGYNFT